MYQNSLEEYMRNVFGYQMTQNNTYGENQNCNCMNAQYMGREGNSELEECYPEIYKIVYPMVRKACSENTKPITRELVEELTNEIFLTVESNEPVNLNINLTNEVNKTVQNRNTSKEEVKEIHRNSETRQSNFLLNDLIRVLIIRELLGRPGFRPPFPGNRPPFHPGRPPFPGPGPRPPMRPREFDESYFEI